MNKEKVNNIIRIPSSLDGSFFRYWLKFLQPFHHLTEREIDVTTSFLKLRFELSKAITDESLLDKIVMSEESKRKVRQECNLATPHFQVILGKLRKAKVLVNGRLNPKFIPKNLKGTDSNFQLLLYFDLDAGNTK